LLKDEKLVETENKYQRLLRDFSSQKEKLISTDNLNEKLMKNLNRLELTLFVLSKFFPLLFIIFNSKYSPQKKKRRSLRLLSKKKKFLNRKIRRNVSI